MGWLRFGGRSGVGGGVGGGVGDRFPRSPPSPPPPKPIIFVHRVQQIVWTCKNVNHGWQKYELIIFGKSSQKVFCLQKTSQNYWEGIHPFCSTKGPGLKVVSRDTQYIVSAFSICFKCFVIVAILGTVYTNPPASRNLQRSSLLTTWFHSNAIQYS